MTFETNVYYASFQKDEKLLDVLGEIYDSITDSYFPYSSITTNGKSRRLRRRPKSDWLDPNVTGISIYGYNERIQDYAYASASFRIRFDFTKSVQVVSLVKEREERKRIFEDYILRWTPKSGQGGAKLSYGDGVVERGK